MMNERSDPQILRRSEKERRKWLGPTSTVEPASFNSNYSRFVRRMRLILPLLALAIAAVVFTWGHMSTEKIVPLDKQASASKTIGKNELLHPRFESTDEKKQPYTITAKRAVQGESDDNLIILEEPLADIFLNSGSWIALEADQGAFRQDNQRLLLKGNVRLFQDQGYEMRTSQLQLDLDKSTAWSEEEVYGQGPAGTLNAKGLNADENTGTLLFHGPAKLVLNRSVSNINLKELQ